MSDDDGKMPLQDVPTNPVIIALESVIAAPAAIIRGIFGEHHQDSDAALKDSHKQSQSSKKGQIR